MGTKTPTEIVAALESTAAQLEDANRQIETQEAITATVIEGAQSDVRAANERAEEIAEAAMVAIQQSETNQRIARIEQEQIRWHAEIEALRLQLSEMAALVLALTASSSSTPLPQSAPETTQEVPTEIQDPTETLLPKSPAENTPSVPQAPRKAARFFR